jgi:GT2 family glycosyltransferase
VVVITHDGRARIGRCLERLSALPERPQLIVVDNGSRDGSADLVAARFPEVELVRLERNRGAAGRNAGVAASRAPYVAFAEDDSWYEPGALAAAADLFERHPQLALVNAQVLVGRAGRPDPIHRDMVDSPLADEAGLPGYPILSFLEGASIVRREAFEQAGGFDARLGVGGPEEHLAAELLRHGWRLRYVPWVQARHAPQHGAPGELVRRLGLRNTLWFAWLLRPLGPALRWTLHVLASSPRNRTTLAGALAALRGLPWVLRERRVLPADVERQMALLDRQKRRSRARRYRD